MTTNAFRSINEAPRGYNYRFVVDHTDLTTATNSTAQDITLITLPAFSVVKSAAIYLKTPFQDTADGAFDDLDVIIGDATDDDRFLTATEINVNGTEILAKANPSTTPHAYVASTAVVAKFTPETGKNVAALNAGEIHIFLEVVQLDTLS